MLNQKYSKMVLILEILKNFNLLYLLLKKESIPSNKSLKKQALFHLQDRKLITDKLRVTIQV